MKSDDNLVALSEYGVWPGPEESSQEYLLRASAEHKETMPAGLEQATKITRELFDFSGRGLAVVYSNKGIWLWEGAVLWIEETAKGKVPLIQVSTKFRRGKFLYYSLAEVLAHEMLHAARIAYEEPKFEEIIAYQTAQSPFRRVCGPLFQNSKEPLLLLFLLCFSVFLQFMAAEMYLLWLTIPCFYLAYLSIRLFLRHRTFTRSAKNVSRIILDPTRPLPVLSRLTDAEIIMFSKKNPDEILLFIHEKPEDDLRWWLIKKKYLS